MYKRGGTQRNGECDDKEKVIEIKFKLIMARRSK